MNYDKNINEIIKTYEKVVRVVDNNASDEEERAYGGVIRAAKGKLQEDITHSLLLIAWNELGGNARDIDINSKKINIPIKADYIDKIEEIEVKKYIRKNLKNYYYGLSVDKQVFIKGDLVLGIECKSYSENAMLKRILIDFDLLKTIYPTMQCFLFQLESQLGGDYSKLQNVTYGSRSTHAIMSYFNCSLNIVTLLKGERKIDKPIHKHFKKLTVRQLKKAKELLKKALKKHI